MAGRLAEDDEAVGWSATPTGWPTNRGWVTERGFTVELEGFVPECGHQFVLP